MRSATQGLVALTLSALLVRISVTGEYVNFVQSWMRWPLLVTGAVLLALSLKPVLRPGRDEARVPRSSWLLLLPVVVVFAVAPPPLGAYVAERLPGGDPATRTAPADIPVAVGDGPLHLGVEEFAWGAAQTEDLMNLTGQVVQMEGFVSTDRNGNWYVTSLVMFCCAADVTVERVKVVGADSPPRDTWVRVRGTWVEGTGRTARDPAAVQALRVVEVDAPVDPYG